MASSQRPGPLFPDLPDAVPPQVADAINSPAAWNWPWSARKARSEFIVAPILLAVRELSGGRVAILSGPRLDVDPARRLSGECDFLLSLSDPLPRLRAPLLAVLEAKRNDIEAGLGHAPPRWWRPKSSTSGPGGRAGRSSAA